MPSSNTLAIKRVTIDSLHLDPANARLHPETNLDAITASLHLDSRRRGQRPAQGASGDDCAAHGIADGERATRDCDHCLGRELPRRNPRWNCDHRPRKLERVH
jgi:hypothetical protein